MILYQNSSKVFATKCKKPKFSHFKGATWDVGNIFIDTVKYDAHIETSWGRFLYFQCGENENWYKLKMLSSYEEDYKNNRYDIDPFDVNKNKLTTKLSKG